jgi:hypothetical protein
LKVLSIWQPYATLILRGDKIYECRTWPAPAKLIGQRIGIAATKQIKAEQRACAEHPMFQKHYKAAGDIERWDLLPRGAILGTATLKACHEMTKTMIRKVGARERWFGDWRPGNFAWELSDPIALDYPPDVRGQQGLWDYNEPLNVRY